MLSPNDAFGGPSDNREEWVSESPRASVFLGAWVFSPTLAAPGKRPGGQHVGSPSGSDTFLQGLGAKRGQGIAPFRGGRGGVGSSPEQVWSQAHLHTVV